MCDKEVLYQADYPADMARVEKIISCVEMVLEGVINYKKNMQVQLVLEEAIVNIISYAYVDDTPLDKNIKIMLCRVGEMLEIELRDNGVAYDPLTKELPKESSSLEDCNVGGLGIYFIREIVDEMEYIRIDTENIFTLRVNLNGLILPRE